MATLSGSGKGIDIIVGATYNSRNIRGAIKDLQRLDNQAKRSAGPMGQMANGLKNKLTPNFAAMGAAVAAAGAALAAFAVKLGVDGVRAAAEEEQAVARLSTALDNVRQGFLLDEAESFIDNLQRATGVADDQLRPALQSLVTATGDVGQAQRLLNLGLDVSIGTQRDLTSVAGALGKAANGQFTQINRLTNGAIDPSILATKDLALITGELSALYGGQAQANAETFAGSMARLKIAGDELLESFGEGFIDAFMEGADATEEIGSSLQSAEPGMREFGSAIADVTKLVLIVTPYIDDFVNLLKYGIPTAAMGAASAFPPLIPIVGGFFTMLGMGAQSFETAAKTSTDIGDEWYATTAKSTRAASQGMGEVYQSAEDLEEAMNELNDEMREYFGFLSERDSVRGYQDAIDDLRKSLKENGKSFDINTEAGRANEEALDNVFESALKVAEGQGTAAEKIATMEDAARTAASQLDKTKMSDAAKAALLAPFDEAIESFSTANTKIGDIQTGLNNLQSKTITVTIKRIENSGQGQQIPVQAWDASGGMVVDRSARRGSDTVGTMLTPGEFVIRRSSVKKFGADLFSQLNRGINPLDGMASAGSSRGGGFQIGTINVVSAPGERADTSLPRALRRASFLAGVNG